MKLFKYLVALLLLGSLSSYSFAQSYSVIVHPSNNADFDADIVKRIFLAKQKTFSDGKRAFPANIKPPSDKRDAFQDKILHKSDNQVRTYWAMLVFSGKAIPAKLVETEEQMLDLVAHNPGVIGYVSANSVNDRVKAVLEF